MKTFICSIQRSQQTAVDFINSLRQLPHNRVALLAPAQTKAEPILHNVRNWACPWLKITVENGVITLCISTSKAFESRTTHTLPQLIRLFKDPAFLTRHKLIQ